ncbi:hypothetical protein P692DRAFT_20822167 [Suillus brevipes Sb2]|nr:hypothetical protein P692DRAFT_20822167 [Suillus brevipes Sb2]
MYYQNFNTYVDYRQIRDHHRELATADSHSKLTVLSLVWELNATCFRKLTDSEFNEWSNQRFQAAMDQAKVERDARMAVDGEGQENRIEGSDNEPPLDSTDHQPVSTSLPRQQQTSAHSVNVVTMANGIGQKRGPRTKKRPGQSEANPAMSQGSQFPGLSTPSGIM